MMVATSSIRELSSQHQKAKRQAKLIWLPPLLVVIKEVATATKNDHASKVNIATTPSVREGTATAVKNDQPATYIWSEGLLEFVKLLERQQKTNQKYLKFISEIIMIKGLQVIRFVNRRPCFIPMDLPKETVFGLISS